MLACNWRCLPCGPVEPPLALEASHQGWRRRVPASMIPAASVGRPPNASDENGRKSGRKRRREQGEGCDVKAHVSRLSLELAYVALCEGRLLPNTWERAALPARPLCALWRLQYTFTALLVARLCCWFLRTQDGPTDCTRTPAGPALHVCLLRYLYRSVGRLAVHSCASVMHTFRNVVLLLQRFPTIHL